jgi:hypothetical protein
MDSSLYLQNWGVGRLLSMDSILHLLRDCRIGRLLSINSSLRLPDCLLGRLLSMDSSFHNSPGLSGSLSEFFFLYVSSYFLRFLFVYSNVSFAFRLSPFLLLLSATFFQQ